MKRLLPFVLAASLLLQGCSLAPVSIEPEVVEKKVVERMKKISSYNMDTSVDMNLFGIDIYSQISSQIDNESNITYSTSDISIKFPKVTAGLAGSADIERTMENYSVVHDEITDVYSMSKEQENKWYHEQLNYASLQSDYSWISDLELAGTDMLVNEVNCIELKGIVEYKKLAYIIDKLGMSCIGLKGAQEGKDSANVRFFIEMSNKYKPVRLEISLMGVENNVEKDYGTEEIKTKNVFGYLLNNTKMSFFIDYSGFNEEESKVNSVPQDIIDNCIEYSK